MSAQICADCTAAYSVGAPQCPQCGANNPRTDIDRPAGPAVTVRCPGRECPAFGVKRTVPLRRVAPGVVERPPLHCVECDRALETVTDEEDQDVPKITVHGGPSTDTASEQPEGGEQSSPDGGTSSTSSEKEPTSPETSENEAPSRARTTGNRSKRARTGSSTARGTDGAPTAPTSDTDKD